MSVGNWTISDTLPYYLAWHQSDQSLPLLTPPVISPATSCHVSKSSRASATKTGTQRRRPGTSGRAGRPRSVPPDARGQATPRSGPSPIVPVRLPNTGQRPDAMTPLLWDANYPGGHAPLLAAWPARVALCLLTLLGVIMRPRRRAPRWPM